MVTMPMQGEPNMISPLRDCIFYTILTIMTLQMAILLKQGHPQKLTKLFSQLHVYLRMLRGATLWQPRPCRQNQIWFPPQRLYFSTILTIMTSQMAILFKRAILKHYQTFFHNPCISWDAARSNFMATTPMPVEPNIIFHLQDCIFHYFDSYDVTNGHFPQKGHPQKLIKLFSQLHTYHRMLAVAIILATTPV